MDQVLRTQTDILAFLFVIICLGLIIFFVYYDRKRPRITLRDIPAFRHLRREVDLAVEAGKRLHISLGRGSVNDMPGGASFAGLTILDLCARAASNSDRPPIATNGDGVLTILSQDTLQNTYRSLASEERYDPTSVKLTGLTPWSFAAGAMPAIQDEQISANILAGHFGTEIALLAEAGERSRSLTVAGTDNISAQSVLFAATEEPLLGEELYAAGAYLDAGPAHPASLSMQDVVRWVLVAVIIVGAILKLFGILR